ncbi:MAG TPA: hypothetical protein VHD84_03625 [Candidatus Saccharimonadales bacterium]|nr:hypothetical protein [Candidatus Saccharimonadales bacterium]
MRPTHQIYRDAAAIVQLGWIQGSLHNDQGDCLWGALLRAAGIKSYEPQELPMAIQLDLDRQLRKHHAYCRGPKRKRQRRHAIEAGTCLYAFVHRWNDAHRRTKQEVVDVLNAMAERAELLHLMHMQELAAQAVGTLYAAHEEVDRDLDRLWGELSPDEARLAPV